MKEITQKEALIAETSDKLQDLRTEKAEVDNKVGSQPRSSHNQ